MEKLSWVAVKIMKFVKVFFLESFPLYSTNYGCAYTSITRACDVLDIYNFSVISNQMSYMYICAGSNDVKIIANSFFFFFAFMHIPDPDDRLGP